MSFNSESHLIIQTRIKLKYLNQTEDCLDTACEIKITKLDKNDFIIVKKLNMPIEIDYFGQKKTIKEKSFKSLTATRIERNGSKNSG